MIFFASHDRNCRYENSPKKCPALRVNKSFVTSCVLRSFGLACDMGKCSVCEKRLLLNRNVLQVTERGACCVSKSAYTLYKDNVDAQAGGSHTIQQHATILWFTLYTIPSLERKLTLSQKSSKTFSRPQKYCDG
jgi:hypothetical protein